tara:strand:+ start:131 stop:685 length:555 start_codon:yes stop_codon:yes gene_type:complete
MWKISLFMFAFFLPYNAYAGLEGLGDIKLSPYSVEQLERYFSDDVKNENKGAGKRGPGLIFSISTDGQYSGFMYCPQSKNCNPDEIKAKNFCQSKTKKQTGKKVSCNTFAIKRKIVWNNINRTVPKDVDIKEFINKLGPTSGIMISDAKPPSDLDGEQKKQLKSLFDAGIMTKKEYEEALKKIK